ncbi:hypothetical protein [Buttiauxella sp. A111]|uniref:hypothetical protein n=1 Tax=Buttiauxella sp. A111 TaxID=2563088 RepID=UPI0010D34F6E|nr:hypothetical protein [Buttiauxella sp. A111]GDX05746.1 hypothetical protein BSPA111_19470 [Buttiauxella sp. A111]
MSDIELLVSTFYIVAAVICFVYFTWHEKRISNKDADFGDYCSTVFQAVIWPLILLGSLFCLIGDTWIKWVNSGE